MTSVNILCVPFLFLAIFSVLTSAQLDCSQTAGNFTANSNYARNRAVLLSSLASNVTSIYGFFFNTTVGQGADKIYGLVLCRPDSTSETCYKCASTGVKQLRDNCSNQKEAVTWSWESSFPCLIRYSNRSFFGRLELSPSGQVYNTGDITSDPENFDRIWESHVASLISRASRGGTKIKYASGETNLTYFQTIYAATLCTPDLSESDCNYCLKQVVSAFQNCCGRKQGGVSRNPNCMFRWDLYPFYNPFTEEIAPDPAPSPPTDTTNSEDRSSSRTVAFVVVPAVIAFLLLFAVITCVIFRLRKPKPEVQNLEENSTSSSAECLQFNLATIRVATNNFSDHNKLGQGGFGSVYKGVLSDGQAIAVKRLSRNSEQGEVEFKNEVLCVARLQHRNLVRLLGFCLEGKERLLIYEFLPNSSLDHFVFDANKRARLDWEMRYKIIVGIARGLLYLHEDSQLRIVHRDLKASNILLDEKMNPKISDFGMAKLFESDDQTRDTTSRIVGTFGYMAPEYAMHGLVSVKSDVFSFGVLLLEIITGERIRSFRGGQEEQDLVHYAWTMWNKGTALHFIDSTMPRVTSTRDIMRSIQIALLCVQENVDSRPTMASVVLMLSSTSLVLSRPSRPAYIPQSMTQQQTSSSTPHDSQATLSSPFQNSPTEISSRNEVSMSEIEPR